MLRQMLSELFPVFDVPKVVKIVQSNGIEEVLNTPFFQKAGCVSCDLPTFPPLPAAISANL